MILIADSGSTKCSWAICKKKSIVKEINTIGITKEHHTWENTRLLFDLYGMKYKRLEDDINIT